MKKENKLKSNLGLIIKIISSNYTNQLAELFDNDVDNSVSFYYNNNNVSLVLYYSYTHIMEGSVYPTKFENLTMNIYKSGANISSNEKMKYTLTIQK